ncbi:unnamed protein product [Kuraishia capsulata CBS 1993]|uniref:Major facilitator superfamily (MFS) profile domain-containing protein n=1 Tax=Kuraishia capsulata CBS 1993 TaxID=1382522 RepID=W6MMM4_9ASCO|nr:uncharacterized protein KUCA_T00003436001 [Kuraishia capsulata CBS 1993]CDK27458.1 unnamed protein product [Kuraishia capsulata CBS 1993]
MHVATYRVVFIIASIYTSTVFCLSRRKNELKSGRVHCYRIQLFVYIKRAHTFTTMSQASSLNSSHHEDVESGLVKAYVPADNEDAMSELSQQQSNVSRTQSLRVIRTETARSLREMGISQTFATVDPNRPAALENPIFPEEYTLETPTGLVPVSTLNDIGRTSEAVSRQRTRALSHGSADNRESDTTSDSLEKKTSGDGGEGFLPKEQELDPEIELVTFLINDPANPHNWPSGKRWLYTIVLSCLVVAVAFGSSCVTGALGLMNDKYNVSTEVSILSCSLMVLGFAVGPLLWSPLSEQIGRQPVYFISLGLYTIFNIPCALAKNIGTVLVCRFLCGVFASSGLALVGGSIADMFPTETRGKAIAYFAAAPYGGPVVGPLVCGFINVQTGRLDVIFWVNFAFAGLMWILASLVPETYAPVILKRRARKLRKETGNPKIMTEQEATGLSFKELVQTCLVRPLMFVVQEPVLDLTCFYVCLIYSLLYAFFFAYPVVFSELYGFNDAKVGLMLIPILIGTGFALLTTPVLEKYYVKMCHHRQPTPEDRLVGAMIGSPFPAIALWILGATSHHGIIWVGPASSGLAFGYGMVLIYYSLNNYIIDTYAKYAASALATKVFLRSAGGAAFPLFTMQMYRKLGLDWASWLLAFISTAMILLPFVFYKFGGTLRAKLCKQNYAI